MSSPQLSRCLSRLTILGFNRNLQPQSINAIPAFLPGLEFLSVPGDLVEETFFDMLGYMTPPLALVVLEFGNPHFESVIGFSTASLVETLDAGLANLRAVGFAEAYLTEQRILEDEEIDNVLQARVKEKKALARRSAAVEAGHGTAGIDTANGNGNETAVNDDDDDDPDAGVYYL